MVRTACFKGYQERKMKAMTPEERFERIERQLEFLAESQGRLFTSIEKHDAEIALHSAQLAEQSAQIAQHHTQIVKLTDVVMSLAHIVEEQGRRMEKQGQRTDERLNALINTVERYISNGRK
jgi:chromosome segregation ATPase